MTAGTIEAFEHDTALTDSALVVALVDQRRVQLGDELGGGASLTTFTAVSDVLGELLDGEPVDRWRERAAVGLRRLGVDGTDHPGIDGIASEHPDVEGTDALRTVALA